MQLEVSMILTFCGFASLAARLCTFVEENQNQKILYLFGSNTTGELHFNGNASMNVIWGILSISVQSIFRALYPALWNAEVTDETPGVLHFIQHMAIVNQ